MSSEKIAHITHIVSGDEHSKFFQEPIEPAWKRAMQVTVADLDLLKGASPNHCENVYCCLGVFMIFFTFKWILFYIEL